MGLELSDSNWWIYSRGTFRGGSGRKKSWGAQSIAGKGASPLPKSNLQGKKKNPTHWAREKPVFQRLTKCNECSKRPKRVGWGTFKHCTGFSLFSEFGLRSDGCGIAASCLISQFTGQWPDKLVTKYSRCKGVLEPLSPCVCPKKKMPVMKICLVATLSSNFFFFPTFYWCFTRMTLQNIVRKLSVITMYNGRKREIFFCLCPYHLWYPKRVFSYRINRKTNKKILLIATNAGLGL